MPARLTLGDLAAIASAPPRLLRLAVAMLVSLAPVIYGPTRADAQTVDVHPGLVPAWQALIGLRSADGQDVGSSYSLITEATGVRMTVGAPPHGADAGFDPPRQRIIVSANLLGEDQTALAALLPSHSGLMRSCGRGAGGQHEPERSLLGRGACPRTW